MMNNRHSIRGIDMAHMSVRPSKKKPPEPPATWSRHAPMRKSATTLSIRTVLSAALLLLVAVVASAQNTSVYTPLSDTKCKTVELTDEEGGSYKGICRGVGGYKLEVLEGDLRQTVNVIDAKGKSHELKLWDISGGFSAVGEQAEWRMKGRVPVGLIIRYNVSENPEDSSKRTSYLVVAKITKDEICVTAALRPTRSHNYEARKLADKSATRPCLKATE